MSKEPKAAEQINTPLVGKAARVYSINKKKLREAVDATQEYLDIYKKFLGEDIKDCIECKADTRHQLIEEIDPHIEPFCGSRVSTLKDCLSHTGCEVRNNCLWFWWQQFRKSK